MIEWIIRHNWSNAWTSVTIPLEQTSDALFYCVTEHNETVIDTLPNISARETVDYCMNRPHEYTVFAQN